MLPDGLPRQGVPVPGHRAVDRACGSRHPPAGRGDPGKLRQITVAIADTPSLRRQKDDPGRIEILAAEGEPFPIADAATRTEAAECVRRALVSEGIEVAEVEAEAIVRAATGWGRGQ